LRYDAQVPGRALSVLSRRESYITPVYLDVEGLPDGDFYYLIGVRCGKPNSAIQHSLWADNIEDEKGIWTEFLNILARVQNPVLIHYGSYETTFLKTAGITRHAGMARRAFSPRHIGTQPRLADQYLG